MKKFASVLLAVLVVFSMFSFVVSAVNPAITVSASKTEGIKAGDKVTVTVALSKDSGLGTLDVELNYDAEAFKVVKATGGSVFGYAEINKDLASKVKFVGASGTPVVAEGALFTVEFEALKAADSNMSITVKEATDDAYAAVEVTANTVAFKGFVDAPVVTPDPEDACKDGNHDYSKADVVKEPTCKEPGKKQASCKVCGEKLEEAIPATGKCVAKSEWETVKAATATEAGEKVQKCKFCGEVVNKKVVPALGSTTTPTIPNTDAQA